MKINLRKLSFITIIYTAVLIALTGCGNKNPLLTEPTEESAEFLLKASQNAEKKLGQLVPPGGGKYGQCMKGTKKDKQFCQELYKQMIMYAKSSEINNPYRKLSIENLTNTKAFYYIQDDYHNKVFTAI